MRSRSWRGRDGRITKRAPSSSPGKQERPRESYDGRRIHISKGIGMGAPVDVTRMVVMQLRTARGNCGLCDASRGTLCGAASACAFPCTFAERNRQKNNYRAPNRVPKLAFEKLAGCRRVSIV